MSSYWPFGRGSKSSTSSFEKSLQQLSTKITGCTAQLDTFRTKQRRFKALITLYGGFAYILVVLILTLVTGFDKWTALEWTTVSGTPVAIYGLRKIVDVWYEWRIQRTQTYLDGLVKERDGVVKKLKEATKYDSTQQLLEKYGGVTPKPRGRSPQPPGSGSQRKVSGKQDKVPRTGFAPPPTANIPGRQPPPQNSLDARMRSNASSSQQEPNESFAPNAFDTLSRPPPQQIAYQSSSATTGPAWYDRIMDVVLGEDETQAKNRIVLLCSSCRLVNGQAPPGTKSLEELGKWRCSGCGALNGVESEESKVLKHVRETVEKRQSIPLSPGPDSVGRLSGEESGYEHVEGDEDGDEGEQVQANETQDAGADDSPPAGSTRSKARQKKKA